MAFARRRFKRRRTFRRRRFNRRGRGRRTRMGTNRRFTRASKAIIRYPSTFPDRLFVKLIWVGNFTLDAGAAAIAATATFRMNGIFNPDVGGVEATAHSVLGWDQWSPMYNSYRVSGSKMVVSFASAAAQNMICFLTPESSGSSPSSATIQDIVSSPRIKWRQLGTNAGNGNRRTIAQYMTIAAVEGVTKEKVRVFPNYEAVMTANPSSSPVWRVGVASMTETVDVAICNVIVRLKFYTELFNREALAQSDI